MTGQGPRIDPAAEPERSADVDAAARVGTWASQQAYQLGAEQARTPEAGRTVGFDVGYSANTEDRAYVHAVMDGFTDGCMARHQLVTEAKEYDRAAAQTEHQAELEAG